MSSLTEEQRRRIEENRRKALERRAASAARVAGGSVSANSNNSSNSSLLRNPQGVGAPPVSSSRPSASGGGSTHTSAISRPQSATTAKSQATPAAVITGKVVGGSCAMVTRERFVVEIGYHPQLLSIFKSIDGAKYDPESKRWTFPFSKHAALLSAVQCLRPDVSIVPLPPFVQRIFRNVVPGVPRHIPSVDLGNIDNTLVKALMKFQVDGVQFGISRQGRCLIGDDMGLGKSIQALGIAHYYYLEWPLLIVCPSSMRYSWRDSIWKWLPSVSSTVYVIETAKDDISNAQIMITSYDLLSKRSEEFMKCGVVIMDESHHLKNFKTARTKAALPIMKNARRLVMLSGTPALSRPIELYNQISAINSSLIMYNDYGTRYCNGKKNAWGWDFSGSSNLEELQLLLEETVMIRRLKSEVLEQLPSKMRKVLVLDPKLVNTKNQSLKKTANAFNNGKNLKGMERRGKLLEYYSETANAKLDAVTAYLKELVESGKKFICFSHHKVMMDGICSMLEEINCRYIRIDGSTAAEDRKIAVDLFQTRSDILVAVLSITAANSGITLTAANLVVFAELYWNPGILTQAEDRAHRIGQNDSVLVEYLIARGTADDALWPMIQEKLKVLNSAGLSKDDFCDANATSLVQKEVTKQNSVMMDWLSQSSESDKVAEDELKSLESDKMLLDQLLDESFN